MKPKTTSQTAAYAYDPTSAGLFKTFHPAAVKALQGLISDPFGTPFFRLGLGQALEGARGFGSRLFQNLSGNLAAGGFGGGNLPAYLQSQTARAGRAGAGFESRALLGMILGQQAPWMQALQAGLGYQPLVTGQTTTSGTGRRAGAAQDLFRRSGSVYLG